jgi:glutamyl-tRNA synthetase/glutamyl-Q tRNA(Asp) synthetase
LVVRPDLNELRRRLQDAPVTTRFAPSPTGLLHLGHVVNAIYVWGLAGALDGTVLVRVEDHDRIRSRPEFERSLFEDLQWLGFVNEATPFSRQQDRHAAYDEALTRLRRVSHVYACDCSRTSFQGEQYPGRCRERGLAAAPGRSLRVQIDDGIETADDLLQGRLEQAPASQCGDLVVKDRDGHWTYQFAVTVDDILQGVTLVVRGADLVPSTGRQVRLGRMLRVAGVGSGSRWPPQYLHHPLILDEQGRKLSKSTGAAGVRRLREAGVTAADVIGRAAAAVGLTDRLSSIGHHDVAALF